MSTFSGTRTDGLDQINAVLEQEANRIGSDIHAENVHISPWLDLIPKGTFPEGMGYRLQVVDLRTLSSQLMPPKTPLAYHGVNSADRVGLLPGRTTQVRSTVTGDSSTTPSPISTVHLLTTGPLVEPPPLTLLESIFRSDSSLIASSGPPFGLPRST